MHYFAEEIKGKYVICYTISKGKKTYMIGNIETNKYGKAHFKTKKEAMLEKRRLKLEDKWKALWKQAKGDPTQPEMPKRIRKQAKNILKLIEETESDIDNNI